MREIRSYHVKTLLSPCARDTLEYIGNNGPVQISVAKMEGPIGWSARAICEAIRKLETAGLVRVDRSEKVNKYEAFQ